MRQSVVRWTVTWFMTSVFFTSLVMAQTQIDFANIALSKPANQTGAYGGAKAHRAVDGRYDKNVAGVYYLSVCAYPDTTWYGNTAAKWWLDLEDVYSIHNVTVYNTYNEQAYKRMNNFEVRIVSEDWTASESCGVYSESEPIGRGASYTFTCDRVEGRYVVIDKLPDREDRQHLVLCEVEVYGERTERDAVSTGAAQPIPVTTAVRKSNDMTTPSSTQITTSTGAPPETSKPPTTPDCPDGWYGENCQQKCGRCTPFDPPVYNACHRTGKCINGCVIWWTGDKCQQEIAPASYTNQQITITSLRSDRVELLLEQVSIMSSLSQFYGYTMDYGDKSFEVPHDGTRTKVMVTLTDLSYNTEYAVTVKPYRVMNERYDYGVSYPERVFKTKCVEPGLPVISAITVDDVIKVQYQAPNITGCDKLTRIDLYYQSIYNNEWKLVNKTTGLQEAEVQYTETGACVFKVVVTNNEQLYSEISTPIIKAIPKNQDSIFSKVTLLPWSLFIGSVVLNVCVITFLVNAYCGKSRRRRERPQKKQIKEGQQFGIANPQIGLPNPRLMTQNPQDNVEVEYATHISDVTTDSTSRSGKEKKRKKDNNPDQTYNNFMMRYNTTSPIQETFDFEATSGGPEEDYEYTRHIVKENRKKAQKVKRVKKGKKERKRIAPHYKNSDVEENEYTVVF